MKPEHGPTLEAWMAFSFRTHDKAVEKLCVGAWRRMAADPRVDPNFHLNGETLLTQLLMNQKDQSRNKGDTFETVAMDLLARGANPWRPTLKSASNSHSPMAPLGLWAFHLAIMSEAWPTVQALCEHPSRPAWNTLLHEKLYQTTPLVSSFGRMPDLLKAMVRAGLDPQWRDTDGVPLLFYVQDAAVAEWLVERGGDRLAQNEKGENVLDYKEKGGLSNEDQRRAWTKFVGSAGVSDTLIWNQAKTNQWSKLAPLFKDVRAMTSWRSLQPGITREVNVLDGVALGSLIVADVSPSLSIVNKLIPQGNGWPIESARLAALVMLTSGDVLPADERQQARTGALSKARVVDATKNDDHGDGAVSEKDDISMAIDDFIDLSVNVRMTKGNSKEHFARWVQIFNDPDWEINVLNQWETWVRKDEARWGASSSITAAYVQRGGLEMNLTEHAKETLGPHLQALIIGKSMAESARRDQADEQKRLLGSLPNLLRALDAAHESLADPSWKALYDRLIHGSMGPSIQSQTRDHRAMAQAEVRATLRSRPRV